MFLIANPHEFYSLNISERLRRPATNAWPQQHARRGIASTGDPRQVETSVLLYRHISDICLKSYCNLLSPPALKYGRCRLISSKIEVDLWGTWELTHFRLNQRCEPNVVQMLHLPFWGRSKRARKMEEFWEPVPAKDHHFLGGPDFFGLARNFIYILHSWRAFDATSHGNIGKLSKESSTCSESW